MAVDVAPEGFPHPVYRSGFALALRLPTVAPELEKPGPVEMPTTAEALDSRPCEEAQPAAPAPESAPQPAASTKCGRGARA